MDSKEVIKARMMRHAAIVWGYTESEMDTKAFDPLVDLLMSACATELERLEREMETSRERILNKLIETLIPDVHVNPLPAHGIIHARSIEPEYFLKYSDQMVAIKEGDNEAKDIFFSSTSDIRISDADVRYIAVGNKVFQTDEIPNRDLIFESSTGTLPKGNCWIGLDVSHKLKSVDGLQFFFNWKLELEPERDRYINLLPSTKWFIEEQEMIVTREYSKGKRNHNSEIISSFEADYNPSARRIKEVEAFYKRQFYTITHSEVGKSVEDLKSFYPEELSQYFSAEDTAIFDEKSLWIKIEFPQFVPTETLQKLECYLNCFPALNRKLHSPPEIRMRNYINIIPLETDDLFFDVESVSNHDDVYFHKNPLTNIRRFKSGTFSLRRKGAGRFDRKQASHTLFDLIDLLRDESAAFGAYDLDYLSGKIKKLNQEITDLEQHVIENTQRNESIPYLAVKPIGLGDSVQVDYWSTTGEYGNGLYSGKSLEMYNFSSFKRSSLFFITSTRGGRDEYSDVEKYNTYKKALVSRERIVTREDIKAYCWAKLSGKVSKVNLKKGFIVSDSPHQGILRTLDVSLTPIESNEDFLIELKLLLEEIEVDLNNRAVSIVPIKIKITN